MSVQRSQEGPRETTTTGEETSLPLPLRVELGLEPEQAAPKRQVPALLEGVDLDRILHLPESRPAVEPILVRFDGVFLDVPYDARAELLAERQEVRLGASVSSDSPLRKFVEATYVFGGRLRLESFLWQLRWIGIALTDVPLCAMMLSRSPPAREMVEQMAGPKDAFRLLPFPVLKPSDLLPPLPNEPTAEWALALARYLRQSAPAGLSPNPARRAASVVRATRLAKAFEVEMRALQSRILVELKLVEAEAQALALSRLTTARRLILSEGWRVLGTIMGATFEEWKDQHLEGAIRYRASTKELTALHERLRSLGPVTRELNDAQEALIGEVLGKTVAALGRSIGESVRQGGPVPPTVVAAAIFMQEVYLARDSEPMRTLREAVEKAQISLVKELTPSVERFPILLRFKRQELHDATVQPKGILAEILYLKFRSALAANDAMTARFRKKQPFENIEMPDYRGAPEASLASHYAGSVWAYGRLIDEANGSLYLTPGSLPAVALKNLVHAIEERKEDDARVATAVSVGQGALSLAVGAVCPPAGIGLDLAFGIADCVMATNVYRTQSDEYLCTLDPAEAFADVEPSAFPVVMAVGGVVMSVL